MIKIIKKAREYLVIYKPAGIPTQKDPTGDADAMTLAAEALRELGESDKLWLVHRLDRVVGGILVLARTKEAAAELSAEAADGRMTKEYFALTEGTPEGGTYVDFLYKDARVSKAFIVDKERRGVKRAELECTPLKTVAGVSLNRIKLNTGRYHQIRAQLSHRGTPLVGDGKYGSRDKGARMPALMAYRLAFTLGKVQISAEYMPDTKEYPWSLFDDADYRR